MGGQVSVMLSTLFVWTESQTVQQNGAILSVAAQLPPSFKVSLLTRPSYL
jgi:hypothetical protein